MQAGSYPDPNTPQKRRLWPWVTSAVVILALIVVAGIIIPQMMNSARGTGDAKLLESIDELPVVHTDEALGLDFTEPVLDVGNLDARVEFQLDVDIEQGTDVPGPLTSHKWAFRLYSDAALKSEVTSEAIQTDDRVRVSVYEEEEATWFGAGEEPLSTELKSTNKDWGLHQDYYLVRYVDAQGEDLERPVVTRFNFATDLPAPSVAAGEDPENPGDLSLTWSPVEGAQSYIVVHGRSPGAETGDFENPEMTLGLHYFLMGETELTTWSISESMSTAQGGAEDERNLGVERIYADADNDIYYGTDDFQPVDLSGDELGVVAVMADGTRSPIGAVNASATVGHLPARLASATLDIAFEERDLVADDGEIAAPFFIPYVDFTGQIQYSPVTLQQANVVGGELVGLLTTENGFEVPFVDEVEGLTEANLEQRVEEFNRQAIDHAGKPGALQVLAQAAIEVGTPQTEYEETGLPAPTAASHPSVEYIAQHLLAGTRTIDLSEWSDAPGAPDLRDAVKEAIEQTPMSFASQGSVIGGGEAAEITYDYPPGEREERQQETLAAAQSAIDNMQLAGKTDTQKVTAFNDFLSANVTYDYDAYERNFGGFMSSEDQETYAYAYNVYGAFDSGLAVCSGCSEAMNLFAQLEGIPSVYVAGKVEEGGLHAWNKFQIDGQWLAVDATWNDGPAPNHDYLLITDDQFTDHAQRQEDSDGWVILPAYADQYATP